MRIPPIRRVSSVSRALQPRHLAFTETRYIGTTPGIAAITRFAFGRQQHANPQAPGNRCGDEAVGGGDDHQLVAGLAMLAQQRLALGQNDRLDDPGHELGLPARQLGSLGARQDGLGEALVGHHVELAGAVVGVEGIVACTVFDGIDAAGLAEEFAPAVVAVAGQQGVVEVEEGKAHVCIPGS